MNIVHYAAVTIIRTVKSLKNKYIDQGVFFVEHHHHHHHHHHSEQTG
jgi:hypothetical protein